MQKISTEFEKLNLMIQEQRKEIQTLKETNYAM